MRKKSVDVGLSLTVALSLLDFWICKLAWIFYYL